MKCENCKLSSMVGIFLKSTVILSMIGFFLYSNIKCVMINGLLNNAMDAVVNIENINDIIVNIKNTVVITTIMLILMTSLMLYKLTSDNFTALYVDYLTEINSKRFYDIKLKELIKGIQITKRPLSLKMIDVDSFKQINDKYGHDTGDKVLQHVAKIIKINTREFDICCRLGGDEFVVILPCTNVEQGKLIGERVINKLKDCEFILDENTMKFINVTLSIGIAEWQNDMNFLQFRKCADVALYNSKRNGRNRITEYRRKVNQSNCCFERNSSI